MCDKKFFEKKINLFEFEEWLYFYSYLWREREREREYVCGQIAVIHLIQVFIIF